MSEEEKSTEERSWTRFTPAEWEEAKAMWEMGAATLEDIAKKFNKSVPGLSRRFSKEGIERGCKKHLINDQINKEITDANTRNLRKMIQTKEDHYAWSEVIAKMAMTEVINARKSQKPLGAIMPALKTLATAAKILSSTRVERWEILGLNKEIEDPQDLPQLVIAELTPEQIAEINKNTSKFVPEDLDVFADDDDDEDK